MIRRPPRSTRTDTLFPYTTLFRSLRKEQRRRASDTLPSAGHQGDLASQVHQAIHIFPRVWNWESVRSRQSPGPAVAGSGCQPGQASAEQSPDATPQIYLHVSLNDFKVNRSCARQSTAILAASDLAAFARISARKRNG